MNRALILAGPQGIRRPFLVTGTSVVPALVERHRAQGGGSQFVADLIAELAPGRSRTGARGDQLVEVEVEAPVVQDERTKELLREYATLHPGDPRAELWTKV